MTQRPGADLGGPWSPAGSDGDDRYGPSVGQVPRGLAEGRLSFPLYRSAWSQGTAPGALHLGMSRFEAALAGNTTTVLTTLHALFRILGVVWVVLGSAGSIALLVQLWVIWRDPTLPVGVPSYAPLLGTLPFLAFTGAAVANGLGLIAPKRWSRVLTISLSAILLFFSLASLALIGSATGTAPTLVMGALLLTALLGLGVMLSKRGGRAFEVYSS